MAELRTPPNDYGAQPEDYDFWHDDSEAREPLTGIWLGVIIAVLHFGVLLAVMLLALWIGPVYAGGLL